jgi:hypothetical protein
MTHTDIITDEERQLLVVLVTKAWVEIRHDEAMQKEAAELGVLLRKLSGVDRRVTVS